MLSVPCVAVDRRRTVSHTRDVQGSKFLDPTRPNPMSNKPNPTRSKPKAVLQLSTNYLKFRLLFCMHVKIRTNMWHKSEHSINIKLCSVTRVGFHPVSHPHRNSCFHFADCRDLILATVILSTGPNPPMYISESHTRYNARCDASSLRWNAATTGNEP